MKSVRLPKFGYVKAVLHRELIGEIRTCYVSKDSGENYYVYFVAEDGKEYAPSKANPERLDELVVLGIDLGVKDLAITSDGRKFANNRFLDKKLKRLRYLQRLFSYNLSKSKERKKKREDDKKRWSEKKQKASFQMYGPFLKQNPLEVFCFTSPDREMCGPYTQKDPTMMFFYKTSRKEMFGPFSKEHPTSTFLSQFKFTEVWSKRLERFKKRIARTHKKVVNCRDDYLHKLSNHLVKGVDVLVFESLFIRGMVKNHKLSRAISDSAWGRLYQFCYYKALREGKICFRIGTFFASSKTCSNCKEKYHGLMLNERTWVCEHCGAYHDRDVNAAINISEEGKRLLLITMQMPNFNPNLATCLSLSTAADVIRNDYVGGVWKKSSKKEAPRREGLDAETKVVKRRVSRKVSAQSEALRQEAAKKALVKAISDQKTSVLLDSEADSYVSDMFSAKKAENRSMAFAKPIFDKTGLAKAVKSQNILVHAGAAESQGCPQIQSLFSKAGPILAKSFKSFKPPKSE